MRKSTIALGIVFGCVAQSGAALANPEGAQVVAGAASVSGQGTATVTVSQASEKTILNWDSFSIKEKELTQFLQPHAKAVALNRVVGADPSLIYGTLTANGRLILINPNGLTVGPSGVINANSFIASTADIANENFLAGKFTFDIPGQANARIVNEGTVTAAEAGIAAFVAPAVKNTGLISAKLGTVTLGAATKFTLDFYGDGLVSFPADAAVGEAPSDASGGKVAALVEAGGRIEGANVVLSARAARGVIDNVIVADGAVIARTASVVDGKIRLGGGAPQEMDGAARPPLAPEFAHVDGTDETAASAAESGGTITVDGGANGGVTLSGLIDARGAKGGAIDVKGEQTHIIGTVRADGAGDAGGSINVAGIRFVSFGGLLSAEGAIGGTISAKSERGDFSLGGIASARGLLGNGGTIEIAAAGESWEFGGAILDVSGATDGGVIRNLIGEKLVSSANYIARGERGNGGKIDVTATDMFLLSSGFDASGLAGGGQVRLGGEFQGGKSLAQDELPNAQTVTANDGVKIDVSSRGPGGDGGTAIIWSDRTTAFFGHADARGGLTAGSGGLIETSSLEQLIWRGSVETSRNGERGGTLLLDPKNIIIDDVAPPPVLGGLLDAGDRFGSAVAFQGLSMVVGSPYDDGAGETCTDCGAVYLFTFSGADFTGGALAGRIGHGYSGGKNFDLAGTLDAEDNFGAAVSLGLAVGAPGDDGALNGCANCGTVYLFTFSDGSFSGASPNGRIGAGYTGGNDIDLAGRLEANDSFGTGVSLSNGRLAVGVQGDDGALNTCSGCGAVYLFTFAEPSFTDGDLTGRIGLGYSGERPHDIDLSSVPLFGGTFGASNDNFGAAVSLLGGKLVVGAPLDDGATDNCIDCGAAYFFTFADETSFADGLLEGVIGSGYAASFLASNSPVLGLDAFDNFGTAVSLTSHLGTFAIGAPGDDGAANDCYNCGAVHVFRRPEQTIGEFFVEVPLEVPLALLTRPTFEGVRYRIRIGDTSFPGGLRSGSSNPSDPLGTPDAFGSSVAVSGLELVAGAFGDNGAANDCKDCGTAYFFRLNRLGPSALMIGQTGDGYTGAKDIALDETSPGSPPLSGPFDLSAFDGFLEQEASDVTIPVAEIVRVLESGTAVTLQANNDISLLVSLVVSQPLGSGGHLTMQAGRAIKLDGSIITDDGDLTLIANSPSALSAHRDPGDAKVEMKDGTALNVGTGRLFIQVQNGEGLAFRDASYIALENIIAGSVFFSTMGGTGSDVILNERVALSSSDVASVIVANNDVTLNGTIAASCEPSCDAASIVIRSGRSILINNRIETDGGDLTVIANDTLIAGVEDNFRDSGTAVISMASSGLIDARCKPPASCFGDVRLTIASDTSKTSHAAGNVTLGTIYAGRILVENLDDSNGNVTICTRTAPDCGTLNAFAGGNSAILAARGGHFLNFAGARALSATNGRWLVYSQQPIDNRFDGLAADQVWDEQYAGATPGSDVPNTGNWFVFTRRDTLRLDLLGLDRNKPAVAAAGSGFDPALAAINALRTRYAANLDGSRSVFVADLNEEIEAERNLGRELDPRSVSGRIRPYGQLAEAAYNFSDAAVPTGYKRLWGEEGYRNGLDYAVYENSEGKIVLAFRGTEPRELADLRTDLIHLGNAISTQQLDALWVAHRVIAQYGAENVTIVGHSLGGFLAQYTGSYAGLDVIAVNSAPFSNNARVGPFGTAILSTGLQEDYVHNCRILPGPFSCGPLGYRQLGVEYYFDFFKDGDRGREYTAAEFLLRGCLPATLGGCHSVALFNRYLEEEYGGGPALNLFMTLGDDLRRSRR